MPPTISSLRAEYQHLFDTCEIRLSMRPQVAELGQHILRNKSHYRAIEQALTIPWHVVALIHAMESSPPLSLQGHLHNGDPLNARTAHVPRGRPRQGTPPFLWEESAIDALKLRGLHEWTDWSIAGTLFQLEGYNGWGYRTHHPTVLSPYLWSYTNHYERGKYTHDGQFSPTAQSKQCGAAALLRCLLSEGVVSTIGSVAPLIRYQKKAAPHVEALQRFLNVLPGTELTVDGIPGASTSTALKQATGHYLSGDPREH